MLVCQVQIEKQKSVRGIERVIMLPKNLIKRFGASARLMVAMVRLFDTAMGEIEVKRFDSKLSRVVTYKLITWFVLCYYDDTLFHQLFATKIALKLSQSLRSGML